MKNVKPSKRITFIGAALAGIFALPLLLSPASAALDSGFQVKSVSTADRAITATVGIEPEYVEAPAPQLNCGGRIVSVTKAFLAHSNSNYPIIEANWNTGDFRSVKYDANGYVGLVEIDSGFQPMGPGNADSDPAVLNLLFDNGYVDSVACASI